MSEVMKFKTKDETTLRKYLMGDLSPEEQEELELWLMSDNDACDLLEAAEDDLIDESLAGKLKGHELDRFNNHFLSASERKRKLQFARSLHRSIQGITHPDTVPSSEMATITPVPLPRPEPIPHPADTELSFWHTVSNFFRNRPALRYAVPALVILMASGSTWSVLRIAQLQREIDSATNRITDVARERDEIKRQLDESQSLGERLRTQVQALEETTRELRSSPPSPTLLAFNLMPGAVRSSSNIQKIAIPASARLVPFSLTLLDDNYDSYRSVLLDADRKELWTSDRLTARPTPDGKAVVLTVPGDLLSEGDFSFNLLGISDSRQSENINTFNFRVVRQ